MSNSTLNVTVEGRNYVVEHTAAGSIVSIKREQSRDGKTYLVPLNKNAKPHKSAYAAVVAAVTTPAAA
jgi:hypothetical protein